MSALRPSYTLPLSIVKLKTAGTVPANYSKGKSKDGHCCFFCGPGDQTWGLRHTRPALSPSANSFHSRKERERKPAFVDYGLEFLFSVEIGFHAISQVDLEFIMQSRLASNAWRSVPFNLQRARIKGICYHVWPGLEIL